MTDGAWKQKIENLSKELQEYIRDFYFSYREEELTSSEDDFLQNVLEYLVAEVETQLTPDRFSDYFVPENYYYHEATRKCPVCDGTVKNVNPSLICEKCGFVVQPYTISNVYHRSPERWR